MTKAEELLSVLESKAEAWNLYMNGKLLVILANKKEALAKKKELEKMSREEGDGLDRFKLEKATMFGMVEEPKFPMWMDKHPDFNPFMM